VSLRSRVTTESFKCSFYDEVGSCHRAWILGSDDAMWDLGSVQCQSQYGDVCEHFMVSSTKDCSTPGCPPSELYDPETNSCRLLPSYMSSGDTVALNDLVKLKVDAYKDEELRWPGESLCRYISSCEAARLGLIPEYRLQCYCDGLCHYFNDCCEDAPPARSEIVPLPPDTFG